MAETNARKRPIGFVEASTVETDDFLLIDGQTSGTRKIKPDKVGKANTSDLNNDAGFQNASEVAAAIAANIDDGLNTAGKAADSKAVGDALATKVDAASGKGLSTNDYTTAEKTKLAGVATGATRVLIDSGLSESGKAADAAAVGTALETKANASETETALAGKVDKAAGKGLSTNDYTTAEKTKLAGIQEGAAAVDATLSVTGKAADAKKVGDEITAIKTDLTQAEALTAPAFSTATNYTAGQYVTYEGAMYQFTQNHAAGAWNSAHVTAVDVAEVLEDFETRKANIDGSYDELTSGSAKQLLSTVSIEDSTPYNFRTSGGSIDIGDREVDKIVGGTVAWNQCMKELGEESISGVDCSVSVSDNIATSTPTATTSKVRISKAFTKDHVYFTSCQVKASEGKGAIWYWGGVPIVDVNMDNTWKDVACIKLFKLASTNSFKLDFGCYDNTNLVEYQVQKCMHFDLTQMFGTAIADRAYAMEQATAGSGIAWLKSMGFFTADYYPYDAGSLKSVEGLTAHSMVGFNQWDEEWETGDLNTNTGGNYPSSDRIRSKGYVSILPNTTYYWNCTANIAVCYYDSAKTYIKPNKVVTASTVFTTPSNVAFMRFAVNPSYGTTYNHDICINLSWDGERDGEYEPYEKHSYALDSDLELRGIPKLDSNNELYYDGDTYESDGTVTRKYGIVDLGTLTWEKTNGKNNLFNTQSPLSTGAYGGTSSIVCKAVCTKYLADTPQHTYTNEVDKTFTFTSTGYCYIEDSAYTDAATFKTAMSGVYLVYELATPTTEQADPYTNPQIVNDFGTEEYVDTRDVQIPVGHVTQYQPNLRAKLEMAPNSPDGDGDYIVRQTNGENAYVPLVIPAELPTKPTENGTYVLKVTVSGGTPTLAWVAEE